MKCAKQIEDEFLAERLQTEENKKHEQFLSEQKALVEADSKIAAETEKKLMKEILQEKECLRANDFEVARQTQSAMNAEYHQGMVAAVKRDEEVAKKVSIKLAIEDHRHDKMRQVQNMCKDFKDIAVLCNIWEEADAEVEDVAGGICITILLPYMADLKVNIVGRRKNKVELEARRTTFIEEKELRSKDPNSCLYVAEFVIDGAENMSNEDVSYDYSSESGLLHLYIDNLRLNERADEEKQVRGILLSY